MRKHTTFSAIFLLFSVGAFAQITLTSSKHGLKPGDVQVMHKAEYVEPGIGEKVIVVSGSTARKALGNNNALVDAAIVGIIDSIEAK
jgi:microcompartment protein CcmK/EutM